VILLPRVRTGGGRPVFDLRWPLLESRDGEGRGRCFIFFWKKGQQRDRTVAAAGASAGGSGRRESA
jgi:hypothetical protein